jgi:hypothetical protein
LLEMTEDEFRAAVWVILRLLECCEFDRRHAPRRDTGPPVPRHVSKPILANAPPTHLPIALKYAERRAA